MKAIRERALTSVDGSSTGCVVRAERTIVLAPMMARLTPRVSCERKRSPRIYHARVVTPTELADVHLYS